MGHARDFIFGPQLVQIILNKHTEAFFDIFQILKMAAAFAQKWCFFYIFELILVMKPWSIKLWKFILDLPWYLFPLFVPKETYGILDLIMPPE